MYDMISASCLLMTPCSQCLQQLCDHSTDMLSDEARDSVFRREFLQDIIELQ